MDKIRLEVALADNRELYAWPGSRHFEERPIYNMVGGGVISTGQFGLFLQTVFLSGAANFQYAEQEVLNGRQLYHYLYKVPRALSQYEMQLPTIKETVGFGGSVWIDPVSLDVVRLEILVREIPAKLPLVSGRIVIDYARQHVGSGEFLLPRSVEQDFVSSSCRGSGPPGCGQDSRNYTSFSGCREYKAESAISFGGDPKTMPVPSPAKPPPLQIPPGIEIESKLETELDSERVARGDPFEATVTKSVLLKGTVVVPKGATIHGRVDGIIRTEAPNACTGVILHPEWIGFKAQEGAFAADQVSLPFLNPSRMAHDPCPSVPEPGSATLQLRGRTFRITNHQLILWRTTQPDKLP